MKLNQVETKRSGDAQRVQHSGGGHKPRIEQDPTLLQDLEALLERTTRGDPQSSPLRWTCKSAPKLAAELNRNGLRVSSRAIYDLLRELNYSLPSNRKTKEGRDHPDRDAQFEHLNAKVIKFQQRGQPVIWVDTQKKELIGDFKNGGRGRPPQGNPEPVRIHDFADSDLGRAISYGAYDVAANQGWVRVETDQDTAEFAVETICRWWRQMGCRRYPQAFALLIAADGSGKSGCRCLLWKVALQRLAEETGLCISVCHFPPEISKWNKIEHRMLAHITQNWRGQPLISHEVTISLIANTTTQKGLKIRAKLDTGKYLTGIKVTDQELPQVQIEKDDFHGEWNYRILPKHLI